MFKPCAFAMAALLAAATAQGAQAQMGERARIGIFEIDRTEVTIGQFQEFTTTTRYETEAEKAGGGFEWGTGWKKRSGWTVYRPYGREPSSLDEPAVHVSWHEAQAYCRWRGGRLPRLQEWQRAAYRETRDTPTDGFEPGRTYQYPVGDVPDGWLSCARER